MRKAETIWKFMKLRFTLLITLSELIPIHTLINLYTGPAIQKSYNFYIDKQIVVFIIFNILIQNCKLLMYKVCKK